MITNNVFNFQQEDKTPGYTVLRFDVEDADTEANGPPYKFDIVEGQPDHEFKVDGNGVLTTAARFNRDIKDQYDLVIRVYDNGNPSLFTDTTVIGLRVLFKVTKILPWSLGLSRESSLHLNYNAFFPGDCESDRGKRIPANCTTAAREHSGVR